MGFKLNDNRLKILVLGYIVRGPIAGMSWHHIQYVLGLNALGHDVCYYVDSGESPYCCYHPPTGITNSNPGYGLSYLKNIFEQLELQNPWAYFDYHQNKWYSNKINSKVLKTSPFDLLINLSASNPLRDWMSTIPVRVLIDTDPVFTQIRNLQDPARKLLTSKHNIFFTFGENIHSSVCQIPKDGFKWQATRQPIQLENWMNQNKNHNGKFTNIMQWESYPSLEFNEIRYGLKSDSFWPYLDLPKRTRQQLEIALGSPSAPRKVLRDNSWSLINPLDVSEDLWKYRKYIQHSKAEFSISKEAYVKTQSGWFSERSACYLASGRPVLTQETGFSKNIETGIGLLSYRTINEALNSIDEINSNYNKHCKKAREIATEYFNAQTILDSLLENAMNGVR